MKILAVKWFASTICVGVVAITKNVDNWKAYIGAVDGFDEEFDIKRIVEWGCELEKHIAVAIFPGLSIEKYLEK